jgi:AraC-like DNA-binding protein
MTPFVAALPFSPAARMADARAVLDWGVSELLDLELERGGAALLLRLRTAHARPLKRRVEPRLSRHVPGTTLTLLRRAAEVATDGGSVLLMAGSLGIRPATLTAWCTRAALPRPGRLLAWGRVLLAAALAEDPARTLAAVARACDYTGDRSLRRAVRTLLGADSAATPRDRLFAVAASAFDHELRALREGQRQRERARRQPPGTPGTAPG